jgi:hypothetical protein
VDTKQSYQWLKSGDIREETETTTVADHDQAINEKCFKNKIFREEINSKCWLLGQAAGYRRQGRPWMRWIDSIKGATGLRLETLKETVQDRKKWRMLVEEKTHKCEMNTGEGSGKPLLNSKSYIGNPL